MKKLTGLARGVPVMALVICVFACGIALGVLITTKGVIPPQSTAAVPRFVEYDDWTPKVHEAFKGECEGLPDEAEWRTKWIATLRGFDISPCDTERVLSLRSGLNVFDTEASVFLRAIANEYVTREHCQFANARTLTQHRRAAIDLFRKGVAIDSLELLPDLYLTKVDCFRHGAILDRGNMSELGHLLNIRLIAAYASFSPGDFNRFTALCPSAIHILLQFNDDAQGEIDLTALKLCPRLKTVSISTPGWVKAPAENEFFRWWPDLEFFGVMSQTGVRTYVRDGRLVNEDAIESIRGHGQ